ncbi:serine/threonine protein kinase, partial [Akkermansiaceae bacterium]|nr:serine/threonine protein kinase [Akkermansiaceae bacterium]
MSEETPIPTSFVAPSVEELTPLFPAYEIEGFIAQGGMGAVYRAQQKSLDRPVAIKILPREFGDDAQFRASFEAEAKAMARLNHPNLIGVYDFGDIDGMLFIIMEYVQGKALYYSIHKKAIDPKIALDLICKISRGLAHAHKGGILHRDIKPANILLDIEAQPKVGDFGLARPIDAKRGEGLAFGTPGYTAPEVYNNQFPVDQRSDIFSVGAMLFELVKGR